MDAHQDTPAVRLLTCAPEDPAAEVAEWLFVAWRERHAAGGVLLAAVPERLHARVAEGLAGRFRRLQAVAGAGDAALSAVRTLLDGGATLVCGGTATDDGFRPALFVHVRLSPGLAEALAHPAPVFALAPLEPEAAGWRALRGCHGCLAWGNGPVST